MALFGRQKFTLVNIKKKDIPSGLWTKCPECSNPTYTKELKNNLSVCPKCGWHNSLTAKERINQILDEGTFQELDENLTPVDPLNFKGPKRYKDKLQADMKKTGLKDAVVSGHGKLSGNDIAITVTDSRFMMGSMGSVLGEKVTRAVEYATNNKVPILTISGSGGGARMYEGAISLMQMAKTCAALSNHNEKGLLHISVLTNPTMGGVMASFAGIGDVIIAEPKALVGFAGPRVIEQTIKQKLPEGFQKSEFLLAHGLIDMIIERKDLKDTINNIIEYSQPK